MNSKEITQYKKAQADELSAQNEWFVTVLIAAGIVIGGFMLLLLGAWFFGGYSAAQTLFWVCLALFFAYLMHQTGVWNQSRAAKQTADLAMVMQNSDDQGEVSRMKAVTEMFKATREGIKTDATQMQIEGQMNQQAINDEYLYSPAEFRVIER